MEAVGRIVAGFDVGRTRERGPTRLGTEIGVRVIG